MLQTFLKERSVQKLDRMQMKAVAGGGDVFICHCGFVGDPWQEFEFYVDSDNINDALNEAGAMCDGLGATCEGSNY